MEYAVLLLGGVLLVVGLLLRNGEDRNPQGKRAKAMAIMACGGCILVQLGLTETIWPLLPQTQGWAWALQLLTLVITVAVAFWLLVPTWKK